MPYYQDSAVTIYHGDCREILPELPKVDLLLTDPPYLHMVGGTKHISRGVADIRSESTTVSSVGDIKPLNWTPLIKVSLGGFVFCSFHFLCEMQAALPGKIINLLTWHKRNAPNPVQNVPKYTTEHIWAFQIAPGLNWRALNTSMFDIPNLTAGCVSTGERITNKLGKVAHPTQKPLNLIRQLLNVGGITILDPFMGSGTTLRAAKDLGRKAIGIEIEEKYCEIAARRMSQEVLQFEEPEGEK